MTVYHYSSEEAVTSYSSWLSKEMFSVDGMGSPSETES